MRSGVGAMRSMNAPGSYSEYISSDRSVYEDVAARVARAPDADPLRVDAVQRLRERDRVAVVADLHPRVQLLPRRPFAVPEIAVVVGEDDMTRVRDGGRVPIEVDLLNAVVAVGHDHGGSGCRAASRTVQPTPKHRPVRVELDVGSRVRCIRAEHGRIISAPERGVKHPGACGALLRCVTARRYFGAAKITRFMSPRRRAHMIFVPSGDQRGFTNSPAASVSCITPLPSRFITKSWNRSFTRRENTTRLPSFDHAGQPSSVLLPEML